MPSQIQISFCIRAVLLESSLVALWIAKDAKVFMRTTKTWIRLCGCSDSADAGADLSLRWAHMYVFSCRGSSV